MSRTLTYARALEEMLPPFSLSRRAPARYVSVRIRSKVLPIMPLRAAMGFIQFVL